MLEADNLSGCTIGKYKIEKLYGEGGMAFVYKGIHIDLGLPIAFKVLFPEFARQEEVRERFKREARLQFKLQHPNLVRVIDLIDEKNLLGMVMDWVQGQDMSDFLQSYGKPLPLTDIRRMFLPVLSAVGHAHEHHIVHRDLKPANILLEGERGREIPKVMDFGIAKSLNDDASKTKTGLVMGTPYYLAPEQARGSKAIDHRADIYSLGVTLYQMLTARLPYDGESAIQIITAHCMEPIPPIAKLLPHVDLRLESIIGKAMAKSPDDRFQTCAEFSHALEALLPDLAVVGTIKYKSWEDTPQSSRKILPTSSSEDNTDYSADMTMASSSDILQENLQKTPPPRIRTGSGITPAVVKTTVENPKTPDIITNDDHNIAISSNVDNTNNARTTNDDIVINPPTTHDPIIVNDSTTSDDYINIHPNAKNYHNENLKDVPVREPAILPILEDQVEFQKSNTLIYTLGGIISLLILSIVVVMLLQEKKNKQNKVSNNTINSQHKTTQHKTVNPQHKTSQHKTSQHPKIHHPIRHIIKKTVIAKTPQHKTPQRVHSQKKHPQKKRHHIRVASQFRHWSPIRYKKCRRCVYNSFKRINTSMLPGMNRYAGVCNHSDFLQIGRKCSRRCSRQYIYYCVAYLQQSFRAGIGFQRRKAGSIPICRRFASQKSILRSLRRRYSGINRPTLKRCSRDWRRLHRR